MPQLQVLALGSSNGGNLVNDEGAQALAEALSTTPARVHGTLTINLKNNKLTAAGEALLGEAESAHQTVRIACRTMTAKVDLGDDVSPPASRDATPLTTPSDKPPASPYEA